MFANTKLNEMLEDPYCFCRSDVRRYLVRFFEIPKDSHDPLMRMSSCASRGDKNHQGSSSSATRNCFWPDTFVRNRAPAYDFCRPVMRILNALYDSHSQTPILAPVSTTAQSQFRFWGFDNRAITDGRKAPNFTQFRQWRNINC